ncbi:SusD/RagB family nutrient-binding outer membrane lipoprotein [Cochleicola gelatinilyticus]|uniref:SusD/RagB family nutrient-binding outer membrane lipoprotein n=1 Tax=Cochleicola gelatinilyticus TaxID=1763537 RepID=A0A167F1I8_9FLAO|nr:SusD/RagB family nutrient-binding outer membrane lipoprotein [Cochleicola gelatinilyticus]OAB76093.1 hypothetical protein ULVI_13625 [Cochleicola gelatinilyticus]
MKKNIIIASLMFAIASCFMSCSDGIEDINTNPNEPEVVPTNTVFNSATKQYMDNMRSSFNNGRMSLDWVEYWGQTAYGDEDRYAFREATAENIYTVSYLVGTDLKSIIEINADETTAGDASAVGNNNNQIAACRIMLAYLFHRLTDTYGDVPYYSYGSPENAEFQALNASEFLSPVFATQEAIYTDILKELRESADMIVESAPVFTSGDNIFNGDATKWKKFANSLILRIATRSGNTAAINAAISDGVMTSNDDNAAHFYEDNDLNGSPWWVAYISRTDFAVAAPFVDLLQGETGNFSPDPRLFEMAAPISASINQVKNDTYEASTNFDDYEGVPYACQFLNQIPNSTYSYPSSKIITPTYQEVLMEYAEVAFLLSENNGFSQSEYENGVRASMQKWGVASADIDAFVGSLPGANQENVLTQKYVALYMQGHEAWAEYRRTGFPNDDILLLPGETFPLPPNQQPAGITSYTFNALLNATDLPFRITYPVFLQNLNAANRQAAVSGLSDGDTIKSKLFWDNN